jgi:hypothetical protein
MWSFSNNQPPLNPVITANHTIMNQPQHYSSTQSTNTIPNHSTQYANYCHSNSHCLQSPVTHSPPEQEWPTWQHPTPPFLTSYHPFASSLNSDSYHLQSPIPDPNLCPPFIMPTTQTQQTPTKLRNPTLHNPTLHNPTLHNPTLHNPTLHNPTLHNPTLHNSTLHNFTPSQHPFTQRWDEFDTQEQLNTSPRLCEYTLVDEPEFISFQSQNQTQTDSPPNPLIRTHKTTQNDTSILHIPIQYQFPQIENPKIENFHLENPQIENPQIENTHIQNPQIKIPQIKIPQIKIPQIKIPQIKIPQIENDKIENDKIKNGKMRNNQFHNNLISQKQTDFHFHSTNMTNERLHREKNSALISHFRLQSKQIAPISNQSHPIPSLFQSHLTPRQVESKIKDESSIPHTFSSSTIPQIHNLNTHTFAHIISPRALSTSNPNHKRGRDASVTIITTNNSTSERKRKKRMKWYEKDMKIALRLVENGKMSGRSAAEYCHVPPSTLWTRLKQRKHDREDSEKRIEIEYDSELENI